MSQREETKLISSFDVAKMMRIRAARKQKALEAHRRATQSPIYRMLALAFGLEKPLSTGSPLSGEGRFH